MRSKAFFEPDRSVRVSRPDENSKNPSAKIASASFSAKIAQGSSRFLWPGQFLKRNTVIDHFALMSINFEVFTGAPELAPHPTGQLGLEPTEIRPETTNLEHVSR